ncbi:haloalkane dehalogenase [Cognatishimia sp.]|uniref:haloalkane dehalogenase n=1 Tax=Cognatishimia sp. TaxID=2211648 RepID=UPI003514A631
MKRRTFLQTTAATAAVAALSPAPSLASPFQKKYADVLGHKMAYIDEGEGRPVVFLHGNPASSYLWRNIIPFVTEGHRAIAPDLMGMGDSDKPVMTETYHESAHFLHSFLDSLDLKDAVLVIHDWGSALGWHYARTRPDRIAAVAFMEAMAPPFMPLKDIEVLGPQMVQFMTGIRTPGVGEAMILEQNLFLDAFMRHDGAGLSEAAMAEYNRPFPTPASRQIILDWPREIPMEGSPSDVHAIVQANSDFVAESTFPKLMFHVSPGAVIPMQAAEWIKQNLTNIESIYLGDGGHFIQEQYPNEIGAGLADWLTRV